MENKRKHLEFIQNVINRMARNSFMLKSLMALQVAAFVAFLARNGNTDSGITDTTSEPAFMLVLLTILPFWFLDGYFLMQERLFRRLYEKVRQLDANQVDFSMDASNKMGWSWLTGWLGSIFGVTTLGYYALIGAALMLAVYLMN